MAGIGETLKMETQDLFDSQNDETSPKNYFNMRIVLLQNLCHYYATERAPSRSLAHSLHKNRSYLASRPEDALDAVRGIFQKSLNKEIDAVIRKFSEKFLTPAIANIQKNGCEVTDSDLHSVYQKILEEAKSMYTQCNRITGESESINLTSGSIATDRVATPASAVHAAPPKIVNRHIPAGLRKRKEAADSDTESDISQVSSGFRKKAKGESAPKRSAPVSSTTAANTMKMMDIPLEDAEKWNPNRVDENTVFCLGSKANSALGLSAQRGRIYIKHPGLFRYIGDHDDKMWLFENKQKTMKFGGKAFLVIMDDIVQLSETPEYKNNPDVSFADLHGFTLPPFILDKMRSRMEPVYENTRLRYGLTNPIPSVLPSSSSSQLMVDDIHSDLLFGGGSNVEASSPMAPSDASDA